MWGWYSVLFLVGGVHFLWEAAGFPARKGATALLAVQGVWSLAVGAGMHHRKPWAKRFASVLVGVMVAFSIAKRIALGELPFHYPLGWAWGAWAIYDLWTLEPPGRPADDESQEASE